MTDREKYESMRQSPELVDSVNHPAHYTSGPKCALCGAPVECILVTERMDFCVGNAVKYLWRAGKKGPLLEDLRKARWYIERAIRNEEAKEVSPHA